MDPRIIRINKKKETLPPQHSPGWHEARYESANSSQYDTYKNKWGDRAIQLYNCAHHIKSVPNFNMRWGTVNEDISGFVFTYYTGIIYDELGSVPHDEYERIRGSVDGWAVVQSDGESPQLIVLETKSPSTRKPKPHIETEGYLWQILQNIEILDADYALFNNVRLLPAMDHHLVDRGYPGWNEAIETGHNFETDVVYEKYGLAGESPKIGYIVGCDVVEHMQTEEEEKDMIETFRENDIPMGSLDIISSMLHGRKNFNACEMYKYDLKGEEFDVAYLPKGEHLFNAFILSGKYDIVPRAIYDNEMLEIGIQNWRRGLSSLSPVDDRPKVAEYFVKIDRLNIERIERNTEFWRNDILPVAQEWLHDLDVALSLR